MGRVALRAEVEVAAEPERVFELFGGGGASGWLFNARFDVLEPGAVVRLDVPLPALGLSTSSGTTEAVARIVEVDPPRRVVLAHEAPVIGRVTCTFDPVPGGGTLVRLIIELDEDGMRWMAHRSGNDLAVAADDEPTVRVGMLSSYSGAYGLFGRPSENCARLAIQEINGDGGIHGTPVRLCAADDASDSDTAREEAIRLVQQERVEVLITNSAAVPLSSVSAVARAAGVPVLVGALTATKTPIGSVALGERADDLLDVAIPAVERDTGGRRWFVVGNPTAWDRAVHRSARAVIERRGGVVVDHRYTPAGHRDFEALVAHLIASGAENVLSTFGGRDAVEFEREAFAAGARSHTRTLALRVEEATREQIGDRAASGIWTAAGYFRDLSTTENTAFLGRYGAMVGRWSPPVSTVSQSLYDAIHLYADAARHSPAGSAAALGDASFAGPRGTRRAGDRGTPGRAPYVARCVPGGFAVRALVA